jgi:RNA polymerase sigma-70 factor (ECF subfamily)
MAPSSDHDETHARFIALLLQSEREVFRYVVALVPNATEAREVVQSTALELWRKFADYDPARPFTPWACRFALRQVQAHLRRTQRWRAMLDDTLVEQLAEEREAMQEEAERRFAHLDHCLDLLPQDQREVVRLYYHEQMKLPEISARVGRSVEGLYKALQRIRVGLLECMQRSEGESLT